jgi:hypothetical protein
MYSRKAKDSFKTKWKMFCFATIIGKEDDFSIIGFKDFKIEDELIKIYTTEYYQYEFNSKLKSADLAVNQIYVKLKELDNHEIKDACWKQYCIDFNKKFPEEKFNEMIKGAQKCFYCETTIEEFNELYDKHKIYKKAERGWKFEIDRKEPNNEYSVVNCVMACYWCNNAKTDEFNAEEFKPIGMLIGSALKNRLK